ncbi:methyl-accepting chemotaxis protein, partial [Pseudomonas syringae group genomosp. 7]|uniref:methyl-accepting chemotaxis protein n=1 Tax=Pseudomonas syringae group genomosp. 7 TaxID=251699 RepID=UPI00376FA6CF
VDVISSIALLSILLAFMGAIVAARGGVLVRGFAVVAYEVRWLASRTQSSTEQFQQIICWLSDVAVRAVNNASKG